MELSPTECIGGNLFFSPHLYDRDERRWIASHLAHDGIFVDVGANIGAYTLWALSLLGPEGRVVAIEADAVNATALQANARLNSFRARFDLVRAGVADEIGELPFYHNSTGNEGGHSFVAHAGHIPAGVIPVRPLHDVLRTADLGRVDMMKIDIEGFELKVLKRFFADCAEPFDLRPAHLIIELEEGPLGGDSAYRDDLCTLILANGYKRIAGRLNALFAREQTAP